MKNTGRTGVQHFCKVGILALKCGFAAFLLAFPNSP